MQPLVSNEWPYLLPEAERSLVVAYGLWFVWGLLGAHRFYLGKPVTGFVFLLTGGLMGLGWLYDLFTLRRQVRRFHARQLGRRIAGGLSATAEGSQVMMRLLRLAQEQGGTLTVTEGVLGTGLPFHAVDAALRDMQASGYVDVRNHPETGVVQYVFPELVRSPNQEAGSP